MGHPTIKHTLSHHGPEVGAELKWLETILFDRVPNWSMDAGHYPFKCRPYLHMSFTLLVAIGLLNMYRNFHPDWTKKKLLSYEPNTIICSHLGIHTKFYSNRLLIRQISTFLNETNLI